MTKRAGIILTLITLTIGVIQHEQLRQHSNGRNDIVSNSSSDNRLHNRQNNRSHHTVVGMSSVNSPKAPHRVLRYKASAEHWSKQTGVPTALILAVIDQESDGRAEARRYEPKYTPSDTHKAAMDKAGIPLEVRKTSYGLMQMMFPVAWGYGARTTIELHEPHAAIRYGAAHIAAIAGGLSKSPTWSASFIREVAARYNGGKPTGKYAADVLKLYQKYQQEV